MPVKLKAAWKKVAEFGSKNSHVISGVVAGVGVVVTAVCAYKARPKMDRILEDKDEKLEELEETVVLAEEQYKKVRREIYVETFKEAAPVMAPTVVSGLVTIGAIIFSVKSGSKKIADATALASSLELANHELLSKAREVVGEEKVEEIQEKVAEDRFKKQFGDDLSDEQVEEIYQAAIQARGGNQLYYDPQFGNTFKSDDDTIMDVADDIVRDLRRSGDMEDYKDYNDFYAYMSMPQTMSGTDYAICYYEDIRREDSIVQLKPRLTNTFKLGKRSVVVLHWETQPLLVKSLEEMHKEQSR